VDQLPAGPSPITTGAPPDLGAILFSTAKDPQETTTEDWPLIPGYEILGELGRGGMGVVYKARQVSLNRLVALKMVPAAGAGPEELARFRVEAEAAARLQHPNIVAIHEVGVHAGRPYVALEFVDGGSLARHLAGTPLPSRQAAEVVGVLAQAMHYAHERGIIHRDLKPDNILLQMQNAECRMQNERTAPDSAFGIRHSAFGIPKITDFGLAKQWKCDPGLTRTGVVLGTPSYMAPEQAQGKVRETGPAADVYSLGAILYELLTGRPPFRGATALETVQQVLTDDPVPPSRLQPKSARDLDTICLNCLQKEPLKRYASALALAEDLSRFLAGEPIKARPTPPWERAWKWARRRPAAAALGAVCCAAAVTLVVIMGVYNARLQEERDAATRAKAQAQANFQKARAAVDQFYTKVTENKLLNVPRLGPLKKDLLQTAQRFYEELVKQHREEADVRADLGRAYWRLATITAEIDSKSQALGLFQSALALQKQLVHDDPDSREHQNNLADTFDSLGSLAHALGKTAQGGQFLRKGLRVREKLAHAHPGHAAYEKNLAASYHNLAFWHQDRGDTAKAETNYRKAIRIKRQLVRHHPTVLAYQSDLAQSHSNLGLLFYHSGQMDKAEAAWKRGLEIQEIIAARQPHVAEYQKNLAWYQNNLGSLYFRTGQLDRAASAWRRTVAIQKDLVRDYPDVLQYQSDLAATHSNLGALHYTAGRFGKAVEGFEKARVIQEHLVRNQPKVTQYQHELAANYNNLCAVYSDTGQPAKAEAALQKAITIRVQLVREHPDVSEYAVQLGANYSNKGHTVRLAGNNQEALAWYQRAVRTLDAVLRREPRQSVAREILAETYGGRAVALTGLGRHAESLRAIDRALQFAAAPQRDRLRLGRAAALARAGDHARATAEANALAQSKRLRGDTLYDLACVWSVASAAARRDTKLPTPDRDQLAERYTSRAIALLTKTLAAGYFKLPAKVEHLKKDKDLDPLRARADFKKLLAELEREKKSGANEPRGNKCSNACR
jgi:serine/threonine-protein kinase